MTGDLLELAIATTGGRELWKTLRGLRIDISIGGPIWAMKGWPPEKTFDQILTLDYREGAHRLHSFHPIALPVYRWAGSAGPTKSPMRHCFWPAIWQASPLAPPSPPTAEPPNLTDIRA
jgi:hypothetical protein